MAAQRLRLQEVPIDLQNYQSEQEEQADLIADNRIPELSSIDKESLAKLIDEMDQELDFDVELTGYDDDQISKLIAEIDESLGGEEETNTTEVFEVTVQCDSEAHQKKVLKQLAALDLKVRPTKSKIKGS